MWVDYLFRVFMLNPGISFIVAMIPMLIGVVLLLRKKIAFGVVFILFGYGFALLFAPLKYTLPASIPLLLTCIILLFIRYRYFRYAVLFITPVVIAYVYISFNPWLLNKTYSEDGTFMVRFPLDWVARVDADGIRGTGKCRDRFRLGLSDPEDMRWVKIDLKSIGKQAVKSHLDLLAKMFQEDELTERFSIDTLGIEEVNGPGTSISITIIRDMCESYDVLDGSVPVSCYKLFAVIETTDGFIEARALTTYSESDAKTLARIIKSFEVVPAAERPSKETRQTDELARLIEHLGGDQHDAVAYRLQNAASIHALLDTLEKGNPRVRSGAYRVLQAIGKLEGPAHDALEEAVEDPREEVRAAVLSALGRPIPADPKRVAALIETLNKSLPTEMPTGPSLPPSFIKNYRTCSNAIAALAAMQEGAKPAVPTLVWVIDKSVGSSLDSHAAEALGAIGSAAEEAVPALVAFLNEAEYAGDSILSDYQIRSGAERIDPGPIALALGKIGVVSPEVIDALMHVVGPACDGEIQAVEALALLAPKDPERILPLLTKIVVENERMCGYHAALGLQELGPVAAPAVPKLIQALEQPTNVAGRHQSLINALDAIGPAANDAVPLLQTFLNSEFHDKQRLAQQAIESIAPDTDDSAAPQ